MSGYDLGGSVFWVPIFEDQVVLDSPAKRVLNMIYRCIEGANRMLAGSTTLLEAKPWLARAKSQSFKKSRPRGLPPLASSLTASSTPPATGAPSAGGAPPDAPPHLLCQLTQTARLATVRAATTQQPTMKRVATTRQPTWMMKSNRGRLQRAAATGPRRKPAPRPPPRRCRLSPARTLRTW